MKIDLHLGHTGHITHGQPQATPVSTNSCLGSRAGVIADLPLAMALRAKDVKINVFPRFIFLAFRSCFENTTSCENRFFAFCAVFYRAKWRGRPGRAKASLRKILGQQDKEDPSLKLSGKIIKMPPNGAEAQTSNWG